VPPLSPPRAIALFFASSFFQDSLPRHAKEAVVASGRGGPVAARGGECRIFALAASRPCARIFKRAACRGLRPPCGGGPLRFQRVQWTATASPLCHRGGRPALRPRVLPPR